MSGNGDGYYGQEGGALFHIGPTYDGHGPRHGSWFGLDLATGYLQLLGALCLISFILGIWLGVAASSSKSSFIPRSWRRDVS